MAELLSVAPAERWRTLTPAQQERIGAKVLEWVFAELVADDDGSDTTEAERIAARVTADRAFNEVSGTVHGAFPGICWVWPEGTRYLVHDRDGALVGEMVEVAPVEGGALTAYQFVPAVPDREAGPIVGTDWTPCDCLPPWVADIIANGGRWAAVPPA